MSLALHVFPGPFGAAEITGLDPGQPDADASARRLLRAALARHGVVCVRFSAALDGDETRAVASMIGPIKEPIGRTRDGKTLRYSDDLQIVDAGFVLTDELRAELGDLNFGGDTVRPGLFETFHTDDSYVDRPAAATVLHARELPSGPGGNTSFIDMRAAFQLLEPATQARLIGLRAVHSYNNRGAFPPRVPAGTVRSARRRGAPDRARPSGVRRPRALLRSRSSDAHRRDARRRRSRPFAIAPRPRRAARAQVLARVASPMTSSSGTTRRSNTRRPGTFRSASPVDSGDT